jgi:uncharacterized MnhB-related membrane protein
MKKEKRKGNPGVTKYILIFFIIFFSILYFVFQPKDFESIIIPFVISLSLAYLFGIWLFNQNE